MKKQKIHNLLIIDASGSMSSKVDEVRGGINQIFKDLKDDILSQPEILNEITVVDFSSHGDFRILYNAVKPADLVEMKAEDYQTRAMTALYDAIGKAFGLVKEDCDGVLVTIFTDGAENDSKEFKSADVKKLIQDKEAKGWTVTFMGTTQEAMMQAQSIGISRDKMLSYVNSKEGTSAAFTRMKDARKKYSSSVARKVKVEDIFDKNNVDDTAN